MVRRPGSRGRVRFGPECPGGAGSPVHSAVLRDVVREPDGGRPPGPPRQATRAGGGPAARLPPDGGSPAGAGAPRPVGPVCPRRRTGCIGPVGGVAAVHQRRGLRRHRCPVRPRHRLLRVPPAVPELRGGLAVRHADGDVGGDHDPALHQRRDPPADCRRTGPTPGQGPPVGAPGSDRPGASRRLLAGPVRANHLGPRGRDGGHLHRREGPAAGHPTADPDLPLLRGPADREHPSPRLGAAHPGRRAMGVRCPGNRKHLPGGHPEPPGGASRVGEGGAIHRSQH